MHVPSLRNSRLRNYPILALATYISVKTCISAEEHPTVATMAIVAFLLLSVPLSAILFMVCRSYYYRRFRIPPGSFGLPLVGETLQLISAYKSENPEPFIDERVKRFGPVFTTHVLGEPTVFSADLETNRFILQNEGKLFESDYPSSISNLLGKHSLLVMKGSLHKRMHSLTMSFGNHSIIKDHLLVHMDRLIRLNLDSWSDRVFLLDEAKKITFDLTMKQLMSIDPGEWTESLRKEYLLLIDGFFTLPFISTTYRRAIRARTKVAEALRLVIRERRKEGEAGKRKKDMLAALLAADEGFSDEQIEDFFVALLVAGYETTSTTMTVAVKFLTETPLALAQVQEEHKQIRAKKGYSEAIEWNEYKSMHFTQCVVNETLRMANIIGGIFRRTITDVHIKDYTIPKGWKVVASFRAVHLNNDHFNDARTFNPWRWQNNSEAIRPGNVFTPFGGGPRLCPGYELARAELSVFLHYIVTRISWVPAETDKLIFFPTTRTQKRYPIIVHRRSDAGQVKH